MRRFLIAAVMSFCMPAAAWAAPPELPLLPLPAAVTPQAGSFLFAHAGVAATDAGSVAAARRLAELVARSGGPALRLAKGGTIRFRHDASIAGAEAYRLRVTPAGVTVSAATDTGLFYGATTLWQLIAASRGGRISAVTIDDAPAFTWRGVMLDSARHFQPPAYVKQLIDRMAMEKLNVLHWHLTDDQAWRLQIDAYPRLTSVGAWRQPAGAAGFDPVTGKPVRYGGFYTKAEVREIVAYAAERHIMIVPEIEMPGHATAAVAAYPELGSTAHPLGAPSNEWGVLPNLFNTEDSTFTFLDTVLDEVMALFPGPYIHVGGDEAVKEQWKADPRAQARIKALGLKDEAALQGWFTARIGSYLAKHGRRLIGWDEILEGQVPADATVMSWRGIGGAAIAAKSGHDAVLSPSPILYLDHFQSDSGDEPPGRTDAIDWKQLYAYDPVPAGLTPAERAHIIGVQGNLWTEHVRTTAYADRMFWPRAAVIAELGWSARPRDWPGFSARLVAEFARYKALGLAYDETPLEPLARFEEAPGGLEVALAQPAAIGVLRYATNGSPPTATSPIAEAPLDLASGTRLKVQAFAGEAALGTMRSWTIAPALARTRTASEMQLCSKSVALRLEDDGPTDGKRRILWGNIMHPCWIWHDAPLSGVTAIAADVGSLPFNFSLGADLKHVVFAKPETAAGELLVRRDGCDGPVIASIPLAPAVPSSGVTRLSGSLAPQPGKHDLCMTFTQNGPEPLWMLDRLTLEPAP